MFFDLGYPNIQTMESFAHEIFQYPGSISLVLAPVILLIWRLWRFSIIPLLYPKDPKELPYWIPCELDKPEVLAYLTDQPPQILVCFIWGHAHLEYLEGTFNPQALQVMLSGSL